MPRYWVIAPTGTNPAEKFDKVWQFDLTTGVISIGWSELSDISQWSREQLASGIASCYPDKPESTKSLYANMLWAFYHDIAPGDFVIARRGRKTLAAVGQVVRAAYFAPGKNQFINHPNFLEISWQEQPRDRSFPSLVFPMPTLGELSKEQFDSFVGGSPSGPITAEASEPVEDPSEFVLERFLEDFIVSNFQSIFHGKLQIYEDAEGNDGQQYPTSIGPIDILAVDPSSNAFVVIELKKGRPSDAVVGQILRYMGWVKHNLCNDGQVVKGLVVCREPDPRLSFAMEVMSNVDARYYSVSFKLREEP